MLPNDIRIEWDEGGCDLVIDTDEELHIFQVTDPEQLYDRVKGAIGPWLRERDEAQRAYHAHVGAFHCDPDESAGAYELSDPKHPQFHSVHADLWDTREGK